MPTSRFTLSMIGAAALVVAGCASGDEWATWKSHPTHFASGDHLYFSTRNREGASTRVTRSDIGLAREEGWWGKPVTVGQEQILER
ncbi:MAG TPA: hypothetical protein VGV13_18205 [Methylomirabilota bacterium]|jgi:hypothetical protein|nr:hypothetical protein [Methylomirabilota bacterium]